MVLLSNIVCLIYLEKLNQIQIQVEKLEAQNYKLQKQLECTNVTHELSLQESKQTIDKLITEGNVSSSFSKNMLYDRILMRSFFWLTGNKITSYLSNEACR